MSRAAVAEISGLSLQDVDKVFDAIVEICDNGGEVKVMGFGTFRIKSVKQRVALNPMTGEKVQCKPYRTIIFRAHGKLKERVAKDEI